MKKFFYASFFLLTACTNNVNNDSVVSEQSLEISPKQYSIRSFDDAINIARQSLVLIEGNTTRGFVKKSRNIDFNEGIKVLLSPITRSRSGNMDTLMYVVNFEDNQGFAVIAAPDNIEGLLAITESGHFDAENSSGIEGFEMFMEMAKQYVSRKIIDPIIQLKDSVVCIGYEEGEPYISVRWGQYQPEGEFCSNGLAGCVNIALVQIMSYYEYPTTISLTYPNADRTNQALNWTAMKAHTTGHSYSDCLVADSAVHSSIGRLCRQIAQLNNSLFFPESTNGTQAIPEVTAISAMTSLGYSTGSWTSYNETDIRNSLENEKLILISSNGHTWVADGYETATFQVYTYSKPYGGLNWTLLSVSEPYPGYLYHFNWGWYGLNNGYYMADVFNTSAVIDPDTNSNSAVRDYSFGVSYLPIWR